MVGLGLFFHRRDGHAVATVREELDIIRSVHAASGRAAVPARHELVIAEPPARQVTDCSPAGPDGYPGRWTGRTIGHRGRGAAWFSRVTTSRALRSSADVISVAWHRGGWIATVPACADG
jgi:hypothetical protein